MKFRATATLFCTFHGKTVRPSTPNAAISTMNATITRSRRRDRVFVRKKRRENAIDAPMAV